MQQARPLSENQETCLQTACMTPSKSLEELKHAPLIHKTELILIPSWSTPQLYLLLVFRCSCSSATTMVWEEPGDQDSLGSQFIQLSLVVNKAQSTTWPHFPKRISNSSLLCICSKNLPEVFSYLCPKKFSRQNFRRSLVIIRKAR